MIVQTIHEIYQKDYARKLGYCLVMFMIVGSPTSNPQFLIRIYGSGQLRMVDQNDLLIYGNPMIDQPLNPIIPEDWKP